ncbi:tumor necrosis factor receptor superfamily member 11B-like [Neoarius graeffei]|uniref:tumor necrosis factor receptor superfamily member 11B-like n=1 Tax=Neoarius graeffei TaxID=443677 RepID=UPI00298C716A|nr:tumor necrosis factor receptor superfamily member 11B-like [Neoarius graeffei]
MICQLSTVSVFLLLVSTDASVAFVHTFEYEDFDTGDTLLCTRCPPGTYVSSPCTSTHDTVCLPCPKEHFTEFWNFLPKCLYCSNICEGNRVVKEQCSATHNRVCECKEGHYWQDDFCVPHTRCPPGLGAEIIGNTQRNTQCKKCPNGTFSAETSSSAQCIKHTDCEMLHVLLPGKTWHDNICSSCANLTNKDSGGLNLIRNVLPGLFSRGNIRLSKLKRFVHLLSDKDNDCWPRCPKTRAMLLHTITVWTENAPTHKLKALPTMLLRSGLRSSVEKVQDMVTRIEEKISVCQNLLDF